MFKKLKFILTGSEKRKLGFLSLGVLLLALLETFSIGIIIPIMDLFVNPAKIQTSKILQWIYRIGARDNVTFFIVLIVTAIVLFVFKSIYILLVQHQQKKIIKNIFVRVTTKLLGSYLNRPYSFHLEENSAILFRNMTFSVGYFSDYFLLSIVMMGGEIIILVAVAIFLIFLFPIWTILSISILVFIMKSIDLVIKKRVKKYSARRMESSGQLLKFGLEALQGVKEIKVFNVPDFFVRRYADPCREFVRNDIKFATMSIIPRSILEIILWISILGALLVGVRFHNNPVALIPAMAAFGVAALRVLPSIHKIYTRFNTAKYYSNSLDIVYNALKEDNQINILENIVSDDIGISQKSQPIRLENVKFCYKTASSAIFEDFSIVIPENKTVAFAGETGAGKSTLIDILMGLLTPVSGTLYYGQEAITCKNIASYRKKISYVPQQIFLTDGSLESNIAFGIPRDKIDHVQLNRTIQISQLESLVNDLPEGIKTIVGEKGIRLSGGQRQRVAIARALYHNPEILIMDEATSALDGYTEAEVNKAVKNLYGKKTIIVIAHRLTTIQYADIIYVMDRGKIVDRGTFEELLKNSETFKRIANQIPA